MTTCETETKPRRQTARSPERCSCTGETDTTAIDVRALLAEARRRLLRPSAEQLTLFEDEFGR
jgi:hypothetical protein